MSENWWFPTKGLVNQYVFWCRGYPFVSSHYVTDLHLVIINNMAPATIRGVESQGMILATKDGEKFSVIVPEKEVKVGSPIS